ncbi:hypothetical protein JBE27_00350 [Streptomyces albiflaviniger]|nr:hypothetical protein [Streptomyces albiflaviniger]
MPEAARFGGDLVTPMRSLADLSGEAVSLAILRNRDAIIIQRFETSTSCTPSSVSVRGCR